MNARLRSRSRGRPDGQESFEPVKPVVAQQPSDKKTEEKPVGTPYNEPGQERGEGAPAVNEPEVEGASQKMAPGEIRDECADGSDADEKNPVFLAPANIPKGDGQ